MRRILSSSFIRFTRVCSRPAVSTRIGSRPFALPDEIASNTTAAGSAPSRARTMSTPARLAQISSCSTAAARNVSAAQISGCRPSLFSRFASLPTVVVLPVPLTPTISVTCGRCATAIGRSTAAKTRADLLLDQIAQARAVARLRLDGGDDPLGRGDADVGRDQQLFERLDGLDVDRPRAPLRRVGAADDLVEALDDLLLGAGEALANAAEEAHHDDLIRAIALPVSASARCGAASARRPPARTSDAAVEHLGHLRRDRQLDAVARAERERGAGRLHAFGDHLHAGEDLGERPAARQLDADVPVAAQRARAGQHEIAQAAQARPASRGGRRPRTPAA